ncbi:major facilitator superfamily protein, putative [Ichthyophthirius multifiliis]|uniref:Major facilitator superfamily protein, putative n=1 Tax=Ichthyophthirius multifiliis TaxID=5932 RepID=G0QIT1_ICHMU|nr:major facilitator superfamily protein, putative [Ichthyophthirius multifiliis]EGR34910.1 major facilitator superfamily protein, putative [Ichthyophthirius multifiliis]|eukprot:XP_004040214.1 major facilitator superfamily protein, putative [Ichthyophthirius multifiliis]
MKFSNEQLEINIKQIFEIENNNLQKQNPKKLIKRLSIIFLILFSAFISAQNLIGTLYASMNYNNLGLLSTLFIYFFFAIACVFANFYVSKYTYLQVFFYSSIPYTLFVSSGIWVCLCSELQNQGLCSDQIVYFIVLICASLTGIAASTLWVNQQSSYVNSILQNYPNQIGGLSGIFWIIFSFSSLISPILSSITLYLVGNLGMFIVLTLVSGYSCYMFNYIPIQENLNSNLQTKQNIDYKEQFSEIFQIIKSQKLRPYFYFLYYQGIPLAIYSGYIEIIVRKTLNNQNNINNEISNILIALGVSSIIGGYISGKNNRQNFVMIFLKFFFQFIILLIFICMYFENYYLSFFIMFLLGFFQCSVNNTLQVIGVQEFQGQDQYFSVANIVLSVVFFIFQLIFIILKQYNPYFYLLFIQIVQILIILH